MTPATTSAPEHPARAVSNPADAEQLISHLADVMDALLAIVDDETRLVRTGRLASASELAPSKAELSRLYVLDTMRIKASRDYLAKTMPETLAALRKRHSTFQALLQMNLTVLATAHVVSESIMRNVSDELTRKATPQGYGASGRAVLPNRAAAQPLAVSRSL
jgi:hypothetical protein